MCVTPWMCDPLDVTPWMRPLDAAVDAKNRLWRTKRSKGKRRNLFNHKALAKVFRAKLLAAITDEGLPLPTGYAKTWVVGCKCVGSGEKALVYLGRYLYRGVIREQDILACEDGRVTFRYQNAKTKRTETRTVSGARELDPEGWTGIGS